MRWERLTFSDDLDDEGKRWYGLCPREIYRSILLGASSKISWFSWAETTLRLRRVLYSNSQ